MPAAAGSMRGERQHGSTAEQAEETTGVTASIVAQNSASRTTEYTANTKAAATAAAAAATSTVVHAENTTDVTAAGSMA